MTTQPQLIPAPLMPDLAKLRAHPIAAEFPMASDNDFENLKASIADRGFLPNEQIVLFGNPVMILDGRNRLKAGLAVGHKFTKENFLLFTLGEAEAEAYSNAKNGARRHLTAEQKAERIKAYIAQYPNAPSREIARKLGVSHVTVERYKNEKSESEKEYARFKAAFNKLSEENQAKFIRECSA
ncbi:ParB-like chromosome segregation protein Spo0J [Bradyrhizobium sp. USDA 4503]